MQTNMSLKLLLTVADHTSAQQKEIFALLTIGVIESLSNSLVSTSEALQVFFHAENCLFVRKELRDKVADKIMSHGIQLPDLFETLSTEEAYQELERELITMRSLCFQLLKERQRVA